jgi:hypothetical protein
LWHSGRISNKPELGLGCLGKFAVGRAKGRMESTGCETMPIALCDSLLWTMIVARATWSLAPSFFWIRGILGNLLFSGRFCYHGTYSMEACMCMGLRLTCPLSDCIGLVYDRRSFGFSLAGVAQNSSPSFLEAHIHQSRCCVLAWGSYADYHCSELALQLHRACVLFFVIQACQSARPLTC